MYEDPHFGPVECKEAAFTLVYELKCIQSRDEVPHLYSLSPKPLLLPFQYNMGS